MSKVSFEGVFNPFSASVALIETSQLICCANQLTAFSMGATLSYNGLRLCKISTMELY